MTVVALSSGVDLLLQSSIQISLCDNILVSKLAGQTKSYVDGKVGSASDIQSGDTVKTFSKDYKTVTTVYANGNQLVKTFSDDMKTITSVLTDSEGTVIATETKTLSDDGLTISTDVVYG